jgi:hypothetical protein
MLVADNTKQTFDILFEDTLERSTIRDELAASAFEQY